MPFDAVYGLGGDDGISASDTVERLVGGSGNDTLTGRRGDDALVGDERPIATVPHRHEGRPRPTGRRAGVPSERRGEERWT